jgi:hypothetical protein
MSKPHGLVRLEGLCKLKFTDLVGNRTRDLGACSVAPQPSTLRRAPCGKNTSRAGILIADTVSAPTVLETVAMLLEWVAGRREGGVCTSSHSDASSGEMWPNFASVCTSDWTGALVHSTPLLRARTILGALHSTLSCAEGSAVCSVAHLQPMCRTYCYPVQSFVHDSAGFPPRRPRFDLTSYHVGFLVDKAAMGQGFFLGNIPSSSGAGAVVQ